MRIGAGRPPEILGGPGAAVRAVRAFAGRPDAAAVGLLLFPECFLPGYLVTEEHLRDQALETGSPRFRWLPAAAREVTVGDRAARGPGGHGR